MVSSRRRAHWGSSAASRRAGPRFVVQALQGVGAIVTVATVYAVIAVVLCAAVVWAT